MPPGDPAGAATELLAPPGLSPLDYAPATAAEVVVAASLIGWLPTNPWPRYLPASGSPAADDDGYVCGPCQHGKHASCRDWECTCCAGQP